MKVSLKEISLLLNGTIEGNENIYVSNISKIDKSEPGTLSFLSNPKYEEFIYTCCCSAVIVSENFSPQKPLTLSLVRVKDPYAAFTILLEKFSSSKIKKSGIDSSSFIDNTASVSENVYIGFGSYIGEYSTIESESFIYPNCYIGNNVVIGKSCIIYPGVRVLDDTEIGNNCIIHPGVVIGSDGFGHAPQPDGTYKKIPQTGKVKIGNNVEIGANCTIDRATVGYTIISDGVKLDNLIQVGHNAEIGANTVIAAQTGISGSTVLGDNCMIGGQVGFVGHVKIANGTKIGAQSGIMNDIKEENKAWIGSPIYEVRESFRMQAVYRNLPELNKRISDLEKIIKNIESVDKK